MGIERLASTTLTADIESGTMEFLVGATSSMSVGDYLVVNSEAMKVQEILNATTVRAARGIGGTSARAHVAATLVYIGSPHQFQAIKDSLTSLVGDSGNYPDFLLPGQRAFDDGGNEYILLELTQPAVSGATVLIIPTRNFWAFPPTSGGGRNGSVALLVEAGTTNQYVWGQIYGYNSYAQEAGGTSGVTSNFIPSMQTSVTSPIVGMAAIAKSTNGAYVVHSMFIVGAAVSTTTSATSSTGISVPVWLNYPYISNFGTLTLTSGLP